MKRFAVLVLMLTSFIPVLHSQDHFFLVNNRNSLKQVEVDNVRPVTFYLRREKKDSLLRSYSNELCGYIIGMHSDSLTLKLRSAELMIETNKGSTFTDQYQYSKDQREDSIVCIRMDRISSVHYSPRIRRKIKRVTTGAGVLYALSMVSLVYFPEKNARYVRPAISGEFLGITTVFALSFSMHDKIFLIHPSRKSKKCWTLQKSSEM